MQRSPNGLFTWHPLCTLEKKKKTFRYGVRVLRSIKYTLEPGAWSIEVSHYNTLPTSHHSLQFGSKTSSLRLC